VVKEDLKTLGVKDWRGIIQDRDRWRIIVVTAKTLREYIGQKKKKKKYYYYV
jgi:hypothetical protein